MEVLEESDDLNELYRLYGIAAHNCSNIEYRIAHLLLGPKWAATKKLDAEKVRKIADSLYLKPLGALLKEYKQHYEFSEQQIKAMNTILDKRNYLIHRFFGTYGKKMHNKEVLIEMIKELTDIIGMFQVASHSLDEGVQ